MQQQQATRLFKLLNPTSSTQCHFNNLWPRRQRKWQRQQRERDGEREGEKIELGISFVLIGAPRTANANTNGAKKQKGGR